MRTSIRADGLAVSDSPGCFWLFGAFFCAIGSAATFATLASRAGALPLWQTLVGGFLGVAALAAGLFFIYQSPGSRVVITLPERSLSISRRGLFRRQFERHDLASIECVFLVQGRDIDGDPVFSLRMKLRQGGEVPLTLLWLHGKERLVNVLDQVGQYIPLGDTRVEG